MLPTQIQPNDVPMSHAEKCKAARHVKRSVYGEYEVVDVIAKGKLSTINLVRHQKTGCTFAMKVVAREGNCANQPTNEIMALKRAEQHPNVVKLHKVMSTSSRFFLLFDFAPAGSLWRFTLCSPQKRLEEVVARYFFVQLLSAVDYIHQCGICHRDIKADNCLIGEQSNLLLTDFGFAKAFPLGVNAMSTRHCGTLWYMAPEILTRSEFNPFVADVWACGVVLYFMLCGTLPFNGKTESETKAQIIRCALHFPDHVSPDARAALTAILIRDPDNRPELRKILQMPWVCAEPSAVP